MSGGGGSNGYSNISPRIHMMQSEHNAQSSQQDIEINRFLEELLKEFNN